MQDRQRLRDLQTQQRKELRDLRSKGASRDDRLKLRAQQRQQIQDLRAQQRDERLGVQRGEQQKLQRDQRPQLAGEARKDRSQLLEQRRAKRAERRDQRLQRQQALTQQLQNRDRLARVTREQALQGRFAGQFKDRADRRAARMLARQAWRNGRRAAFVAWLGPVFYPYAYSDIFDYAFFPYAYDNAYWAYAYDDFFESVFWVNGGPYSEYQYAAPFPSGTTGSAPPSGGTSRGSQQAVEQACEPAKGLTAWPFGQIERAVKLTPDQAKLLDDVRKAAAEAAEAFKASCRTDFAMTPPGRLQAMISRLEATYEAVGIVRPALEAFYNSLSDEQTARFNEIGPNIGQDQARAARARPDQQAKACSEPKPGLTNLPIEQIEESVRPSDRQRQALDKLNAATIQAVDALQAACPDVIPLTPVGRLEAMEKRLEAMLDAAETVQPALEDFYASLTNEQKARFNVLGRQAQRAN